MRKKIFTFLLALVTSVGLSWATVPEGVQLIGLNPSSWQNDQTYFSSSDMPGFVEITQSELNELTIPSSGMVAVFYVYVDSEDKYKYDFFNNGEYQGTSAGEYKRSQIYGIGEFYSIYYIGTPTPAPSGDEGKLSGAFSINGDGDYIAFSKGNLQYHCTNHVWQFATNQYDIIGNGNANISDSYDGWVDLFGYGTGNNPTLVNTSYSAFSTFTDWGVNAISNGGNEANLWRTLTRDEWAYLFNSRANASSKYGMATVANVPGVIVLPDVYEGSAINTDHDGWGNNIISSGDWAAYETAGAVFLPVAGYREGTTVDNLGSYGFYWSSTPEDAMFSKKLSLDQYLVEPEGYGLRYQGLSVRLVTETTPSSGSEPEPTEDAIVIVTKTKQSSYTQSTVTISCAAIGDSDGFSVSIYGDKTATITNSDASKIISKIELVPGYSESYHSYVRANGGTPASSSESLITFTNVNSNNV
ncbi:MAG: hypothetical protein IJT35_08620, partial [Paludibacteraceae bacterium]|nr:hypothetical protein [Paludibacteraceae bacterium]